MLKYLDIFVFESMKTGPAGSRAEKIGIITGLFDGLYCFTSVEIDEYLKRVDSFPDEGLDKIIDLLERGKRQQDELISHRVAEDKHYVKDLGRFLNRSSKKIKDKWEKAESGKAEAILTGI